MLLPSHDLLHDLVVVAGVARCPAVFHQLQGGHLDVGAGVGHHDRRQQLGHGLGVSLHPRQAIKVQHHLQGTGGDEQLGAHRAWGIIVPINGSHSHPPGARINPLAFGPRHLVVKDHRGQIILAGLQDQLGPHVRIVAAQLQIALLAGGQIGGQGHLKDLKVIGHVKVIGGIVLHQARAHAPTAEAMVLPIVPFGDAGHPVARVVGRVLDGVDGQPVALVQVPQAGHKDHDVLGLVMHLAPIIVAVHLMLFRVGQVLIAQGAHEIDHLGLAGEQIVAAPRGGKGALVVAAFSPAIGDMLLIADTRGDPAAHHLAQAQLLSRPVGNCSCR